MPIGFLNNDRRRSYGRYTGEPTEEQLDKNADYGPLNGISRNRVKVEFIHDNGDELLRVVGSLKLGTFTASEFVCTLRAGSRTSTIAITIAEVDRIANSLSLLS